MQLQAERAKEGRVQQRAWEGRGKREGRTELQVGRRQQKEGKTQLPEGRTQLQEGRRQESIHQLRQIDCPNINVFSFFPRGSFCPLTLLL